MELRLRLANTLWAVVMNLFFNTFCSVGWMRKSMNRLIGCDAEELKAQYGYLKVHNEKLGEMEMESVSATAGPPRILLYLHGGGYFMGGIESYRRFEFRMAHRFDSLVYLPEYRLAPEAPYPAAVEDALTAYRAIRARHPETPIFLGGDSAGGGLALALMLTLRDAGEAQPKGAFLISPWADLTGTAQSLRANRFRDYWLSLKKVRRWAPFYVGKSDPRTPGISPVFGSYEGLPPMLIIVGEPEVLLDDARKVAEQARRAKVAVELQVWPGMQHAWPIAIPQIAEAKEAMQAIASFLARST